MSEETAENEVSTGCGYEAPFFGAHYPDGVCIDGLMWDLDSCDEPGGWLSSGGDVPCPACNTEQYLLRAKENGESTVSWANGASHGTGEDIWRGACDRAREANPSGAQAIIDALGPFVPAEEDCAPKSREGQPNPDAGIVEDALKAHPLPRMAGTQVRHMLHRQGATAARIAKEFEATFPAFAQALREGIAARRGQRHGGHGGKG